MCQPIQEKAPASWSSTTEGRVCNAASVASVFHFKERKGDGRGFRRRSSNASAISHGVRDSGGLANGGMVAWALGAAAVLLTRVWCTPQMLLAQTSPSAMLDQFRAVRLTWLATAASYANRLFGLLALIEFAWTAAILVLEKTDLQGWTAALIRKMMFIGAFFALLTFGADWIPRIINSFQIIGQTASGLPSLAPTDVLVRGSEHHRQPA